MDISCIGRFSKGWAVPGPGLGELAVKRHVVAEELFHLAGGPGTPMRALHRFRGGVSPMNDPDDTFSRPDIHDFSHGRLKDEAGVLSDPDFGEGRTGPHVFAETHAGPGDPWTDPIGPGEPPRQGARGLVI